MKYSNKTISRAEDTGKEKFESCISSFSGFSTSQLPLLLAFCVVKIEYCWYDDATSHVSQFHFPQQTQTTTALPNIPFWCHHHKRIQTDDILGFVCISSHQKNTPTKNDVLSSKYYSCLFCRENLYNFPFKYTERGTIFFKLSFTAGILSLWRI